MPVPFLPYELVERIVTHAIAPLYQFRTRQQALNSFSLVSHAWLAAARRHLFVRFSLPKTIEALDTIKLLCSSPYSTLHLTKLTWLYIGADSSQNTLGALLQLCESGAVRQVFAGVTAVTIPEQQNALLPAQTWPLLSQRFPYIEELDLQNVRFSSPTEFLQLVASLPRLRCLTCLKINVRHKELENSAAVVLQALDTLTVDFQALGVLFQRIAFSNLRVLNFYDIPMYGGRALPDVHRMLMQTGKHLRRLLLSLSTHIHVGDMTPDAFSRALDLSQTAPLLEDLSLGIDKVLVVPALSFQHPHLNLKSIKIRHGMYDVHMGPRDLNALDAILGSSVPSPRHLDIPIAIDMPPACWSKKDWCTGDDGTRKPVEGGLAWKRQQEGLKMKCLHPEITFSRSSDFV
ncbi:hypothetical protein VNI00_000477 [Paramarasmius palmivorus]|uniref:F-box domain-containing protein n=1 Tax=Paramarasmius palmivorus TaxID=297713 RepID=A0AAW0E6Y7_9AGAR